MVAANRIPKLVIGVVGLFFVGCANVGQPPALDMSQPGLTQRELDRYVADRTKYTAPFPVEVLTPEQLSAFKIAEAKLEQLHETEGARNGIGLSSDYLVSIGESDDFFFINFLSRFRPNQVDESTAVAGEHWTKYYNAGNFQPLSIVLSKFRLEFECIAVFIKDCPEPVRAQSSLKGR